MIQTGNWVQLQENANSDFSRVSQERTPTTTRSPSPTNSSCSSTVSKSTITGSRLINLSLFPENKAQILNELEKEKRSTLSKRYSSLKKARSHYSIGAVTTQQQQQQQQQQRDKFDDTLLDMSSLNFNSDSITPTTTSSRSSSTNRDTSFHSPNSITQGKEQSSNQFFQNNGPTTSNISTSTSNQALVIKLK
jgi:hypothetical protein